MPDGDEGLILLTHLDRRGTVMLRYALGDVARLTRQRCPHCGALTERIVSQPRRVDDLVKIKGMLVNPQALVDAVLGEPALLDFQAVVDKENPNDPLSMDRLRLRIVPAAGADAALDASLPRAFSAPSASRRRWSGQRRTTRCSWGAAGRPSRCSISESRPAQFVPPMPI